MACLQSFLRAPQLLPALCSSSLPSSYSSSSSSSSWCGVRSFCWKFSPAKCSDSRLLKGSSHQLCNGSAPTFVLPPLVWDFFERVALDSVTGLLGVWGVVAGHKHLRFLGVSKSECKMWISVSKDKPSPTTSSKMSWRTGVLGISESRGHNSVVDYRDSAESSPAFVQPGSTVEIGLVEQSSVTGQSVGLPGHILNSEFFQFWVQVMIFSGRWRSLASLQDHCYFLNNLHAL